MKKGIIAIIIVLVIGVVGWLVYDKVIDTPQRNIIGEWQSDDISIGSYNFNEDGSMSGKIETILGNPSINGKYVIDEKTGTLTITYSALGISYDLVNSFELDGDKLTLTDEKTGIERNFTRVKDGEAKTQSAD